jgi:hypothetical protein
MTAEQIAVLRGMVKGWWQHTREEVEALEAAIALAGMVCTTCKHRGVALCMKVSVPGHSVAIVPHAQLGGGCRGWEAEETADDR